MAEPQEQASSVPEFSRPILLSRADGGALAMQIEATDAEREALAKRFGLLTLDSLSADLVLEKQGDLYRLGGRLRAEVSQACVVTLEPVAARLDELFEVTYTLDPELAPDPAAIEHELDEDAAEVPELIVGESLDLGEAVAQELSLALDPYPRAPEAEAVLAELAEAASKPAASPFAELARLREQH